ncbi:hypothetical protein GMA11_06610 [Granulicatella sp. zg-ZJ]|uniref:hypothetical protein n=1 Tax=Granulicatella sp. zg-ZJ TaxID=2678504 RepID=UPI0013D3CE20|nr:hypothetical protein [Granulicatella sp. zg-ZJ]NEW63065.1 hypothetical protein [Granulicatella sp. zg-ZJ]
MLKGLLLLLVALLSGCASQTQQTIKPLAEGFQLTGKYKAEENSSIQYIWFENNKMILSVYPLDDSHHKNSKNLEKLNQFSTIVNQFSEGTTEQNKNQKIDEPSKPTFIKYNKDVPGYDAKYGSLYYVFYHPIVKKTVGQGNDWQVQFESKYGMIDCFIFDVTDTKTFKDDTGVTYHKE